MQPAMLWTAAATSESGLLFEYGTRAEPQCMRVGWHNEDITSIHGHDGGQV
jgi:hypothetical protein